MGTGWRRAFCTTIPRDSPAKTSNNDSSVTPRLTCKTKSSFLASSPRSPFNSNQPTPRPKQVKPKAYDDDDPLTTPTPTATGIVTIPDQEDIDADQDFKGFLANPVLSSSADEFPKNVDVMLMPEVAIISSSQSHETHAVVLKVKAPPPHMLKRAPIDLVAVLHVTASKLQMLKRAMRLLISSLTSSDRLSIIAFSACPKRLLPFMKMSPRGQLSARRVIDQLVCSRRTYTCACTGEALKEATKVLQDRRERNPVASIILLSDEHVHDSNNQRQTCGSSHTAHTRFAHMEIPVHTLAKNGGGENAFTKCVGGLLSVVAQDVRVELGVAAGSDPAEISAVYSCNGKPMVLNTGSFRFGDLYAEEEREVLVELRVPLLRPRPNSNSYHVLSARCCYKDPATQQVIYAGEKALLVPRPQAKIQRLRNLFIAIRAVAESRVLVEHNKLTTAHDLLSSSRDLLMQSTSGEEFVKGLEAELVDVEWRVQFERQQGDMKQ